MLYAADSSTVCDTAHRALRVALLDFHEALGAYGVSVHALRQVRRGRIRQMGREAGQGGRAGRQPRAPHLIDDAPRKIVAHETLHMFFGYSNDCSVSFFIIRLHAHQANCRYIYIYIPDLSPADVWLRLIFQSYPACILKFLPTVLSRRCNPQVSLTPLVLTHTRGGDLHGPVCAVLNQYACSH